MAPGSVNLIECDDDLECDQHNDDDFEAQRSARVDDIGKCVGRFRDHGELPVEGIYALFEFVFVFKPSVKPLEVRTVP